jgi:L,D-transpeptidase catalytic domain
MRRVLALIALFAPACGSKLAPEAHKPEQGAPIRLAASAETSTPSAHADADPENVSAEPAGDPFGPGYPAAAPASPHGRVGSLTWGTWIQPAPRSGALPRGGIRPGNSLPLISDELLPGNGHCPRFAQVEGGFVCVGQRATLDMSSRWMQLAPWTAPAPGPMPYHYALSVGAPMLTKPLPADQMRWKIGSRDQPRMKGWNAGHDELAEDLPIEANGPIPDFLENGGQVPVPWGEPHGVFFKMVPKGSMIAYTRAFEAYGQVWVLSSDMRVVPARGLERFRVSEFHGIELGHGVELPIAWIRREPRPKWRKTEGGFEKSGESWPLLGFVALTGNQERSGKQRFLETREPGLYIERSDAALVDKRPKPPWETKGTGKWIHVHVNRGTLTLYEGPTPVFSTLMSPGKKDATPYGRYFIESEHHVSTMATEDGEPTKFWIADVPWTIYFKRPYAIHAAYWHEDFGERKSGGCVNLSPLDAKRVFDWTEPTLPEGWDSVQATAPGGTFVLVEG